MIFSLAGRGDAPYQLVVSALDRLQQARITKVSLLTDAQGAD